MQLGFGLNVVPLIMQSIIDVVLAQDKSIKHSTSAYIEDIYVSESLFSMKPVQKHFTNFRLSCKDPENLKDGDQSIGIVHLRGA